MVIEQNIQKLGFPACMQGTLICLSLNHTCMCKRWFRLGHEPIMLTLIRESGVGITCNKPITTKQNVYARILPTITHLS